MTGAQLKQQRKALGLSLSTASKQIGISSRTLCRWELLPELPRKYKLLASRLRKRGG